MKKIFILNVLLFIVFLASSQNCLNENFNVQTTGWTYSQGASEGTYNNPRINGCSGNDDDRGIITPGVGGNNPASIRTPNIVSDGSGTIQFSFDFFVFDANLRCATWKDFDCPTSIDINYYVGTTRYIGVADLIFPPNGSLNPSNVPVTFTINTAILAVGVNYQIEFVFEPKSGIGNCVQQNTKYVMDNFSICQRNCIPGASPICGIDAIDDDLCTVPSRIDIVLGNLSTNDIIYNSSIVTYSLAAGPFPDGSTIPGGALLVINPDGTFIFTRIDFTKSVFSFTYRVCDPNGLCDLASVRICFPPAGPLPIVISSFSAINKNDKVQLNWKTSLEINAKGFEIEKQIGNEFVKIGYVVAANSAIGSNYSFIDADLSTSVAFYRLKLINTDGTFKYSNIVKVSGLIPIKLFSLFPNPSLNGSVKINIPNNNSLVFDIQIINSAGKTIKSLIMTGSSLLVADLQPGIYLIKVTSRKDGASSIEKIIIAN